MSSDCGTPNQYVLQLPYICIFQGLKASRQQSSLQCFRLSQHLYLSSLYSIYMNTAYIGDSSLLSNTFYRSRRLLTLIITVPSTKNIYFWRISLHCIKFPNIFQPLYVYTAQGTHHGCIYNLIHAAGLYRCFLILIIYTSH